MGIRDTMSSVLAVVIILGAIAAILLAVGLVYGIIAKIVLWVVGA